MSVTKTNQGSVPIAKVWADMPPQIPFFQAGSESMTLGEKVQFVVGWMLVIVVAYLVLHPENWSF